MQSKSTLNKALTKLANIYPNGIYTAKNGVYGGRLSHDELSALLAEAKKSKNAFEQAVLNNSECTQVLLKRKNLIIGQWLQGLKQSEKHRVVVKKAKEQRKERLKLARQKERDIKQAAAKLEKQRTKLVKKLNLTNDQKELLRQLSDL